MAIDDYKVILYRNQPQGWVAEIPSIDGIEQIQVWRRLGETLQLTR